MNELYTVEHAIDERMSVLAGMCIIVAFFSVMGCCAISKFKGLGIAAFIFAGIFFVGGIVCGYFTIPEVRELSKASPASVVCKSCYEIINESMPYCPSCDSMTEMIDTDDNTSSQCACGYTFKEETPFCPQCGEASQFQTFSSTVSSLPVNTLEHGTINHVSGVNNNCPKCGEAVLHRNYWNAEYDDICTQCGWRREKEE